jgi:CHAD domain-containing protein
MAPARRRYTAPRLNPTMACDTAFRIVARRGLDALSANREATCRGDPSGLHQMRIALTRLRTTIVFFTPMVADSERKQIRHKLKWLNTQLGVVRDLDVAIKRLETVNEQPSDYARSLNEKRTDMHRALARALRSARYRQLFASTSDWIENGPWSIRKAKPAKKQRGSPIAEYSAGKLARWHKRLLKTSRKLLKMDAEKRHRLRLSNKKLSYAIESLEDLFSDSRFRERQAALKHLRKAQKYLGQLNDDAKGHSLAVALRREGIHTSLKSLGPKREQRLLRTAAAAYRKLAVLTK